MFMLLFRASNKQTTAFIYVYMAKTTSHDWLRISILQFSFVTIWLSQKKYLHAVLRGNMEQSFVHPKFCRFQISKDHRNKLPKVLFPLRNIEMWARSRYAVYRN